MVRVIGITVLLASSGLSADWSSLYDPGQLVNQQQRLRKDVDAVIAQEIQPFLTLEQLHAFSKIRVDLPPSGPPEPNPFDCYSATDQHITLPLLTVAFIEDMSEAYSWLWANHYSSLTVDEYLAMLRNRSANDFPGGRYPSPLLALHIPSNALDNPAVAKMTQRVRGTTLSFLLLHQFSHLSYRTAAEEAAIRRNPEEAGEERADRFALEVMKNNSETPAGLLMLIQGMMYLPTTAPKNHPLTSERMRQIANYLDLRVVEFAEGRSDRRLAMLAIQALASHIRQAAKFLSDFSGQENWAEQGRRTTIADLAPRQVADRP